jgi:hypothetical protein
MAALSAARTTRESTREVDDIGSWELHFDQSRVGFYQRHLIRKGGAAKMKRRLLSMAIAVLLSVFVVQAPVSADVSQLGAKDSQTNQSTGGRATISEPAAQPDDGFWRYYWTGITLNNGNFLQGGYADPPSSSGCSSLGWFYWSWNAAGAVQNGFLWMQLGRYAHVFYRPRGPGSRISEPLLLDIQNRRSSL